jgi:hypothetical protein
MVLDCDVSLKAQREKRCLPTAVWCKRQGRLGAFLKVAHHFLIFEAPEREARKRKLFEPISIGLQHARTAHLLDL